MSVPQRTPPHPRAPTTSRVWFPLAALVLSAGCAGTVETPDFRGGGRADAEIVLSVENQHFSDIVIYLSQGGSWQRLGEVTGATRGRLQIPSALTAPATRLQFRVHPIGGQDRDDYVTGAIYANRGDIIELRVAGSLRMSSWWIR